ncbi:Hypothetical protein DEACI_3665 [Acididesulfobacillus acetoxydans]|uniref:Uncharacterized protein n=1 Tax=Acididesulfobacillus acetoxydans TaxID=1561005 RepID=A0A8S0WHP9_9FIRM|nr:Hypothetical protein DEACI_3665 [Acididesulfobacillus acetoxydans]CEJ05723.1 Hypothetical protein DEACI_0142 [Acididesulfobacillus acetoxydans]
MKDRQEAERPYEKFGKRRSRCLKDWERGGVPYGRRAFKHF